MTPAPSILWTLLLLPGAAAFFALAGRGHRAANALAGAFLLVLDVAVENAGAAAGLWRTVGAGPLAVGVTPLPVLALAFMAGASLGPFLELWPARAGGRWGGLALLALGGAAVEAALVAAGLMRYHPPWNGALAFGAYLAALGLTAWARERVKARWAAPEAAEASGVRG